MLDGKYSRVAQTGLDDFLNLLVSRNIYMGGCLVNKHKLALVQYCSTKRRSDFNFQLIQIEYIAGY